ncbi:unnamed protein product [Urochloa humidicola]
MAAVNISSSLSTNHRSCPSPPHYHPLPLAYDFHPDRVGSSFLVFGRSTDRESSEMAGRLLFQKLAYRMSESTSLLCARASVASARDFAPLTRRASEGGIGTLSGLFRGSAHPCSVVPSSHEGSIIDLSNLVRGASAHPSTLAPKQSFVHQHAAKYLDALPCFSPAAKMCNPATGMPSHCAKPASVDSVKGVKITFSSSSSEKGTIWDDLKANNLAELEAAKATLSEADYEAEKAAIIAEVDKFAAADKAFKDDIVAWKKNLDETTAEFNRFSEYPSGWPPCP